MTAPADVGGLAGARQRCEETFARLNGSERALHGPSPCPRCGSDRRMPCGWASGQRMYVTEPCPCPQQEAAAAACDSPAA